jgi:hypothetical protein
MKIKFMYKNGVWFAILGQERCKGIIQWPHWSFPKDKQHTVNITNEIPKVIQTHARELNMIASNSYIKPGSS